METTNGRWFGVASRGRELRGRSAHATGQPLLGRLRPPRGEPRLQYGLHLITSRRRVAAADGNGDGGGGGDI